MGGFEGLLVVGAVLALAVYIIVVANRRPQFEQPSGVRGMLWTLLLFNLALGVLALLNALMTLSRGQAQDGAGIPLSIGLLSLGVAALSSGFGAFTLTSETFRLRLRALLPAHATYAPNSPLHATALVLILLLISTNLITFFLVGGIAGMAEDLAANGVDLSSLFLQQLVWIAAAALGVGLFSRRTLPAVGERLGLRLPTLTDLRAGIVTAVACLLVAFSVALVWSLFTSPDLLEQQTAASRQLSASVSSLGAAFVLSLAVAIGEEILFRGAFLPVFGNVLTSVFFAIIHTQYALTPATAIIFVVSLLLGALRTRFSTSAAIVGHFTYNFIQLALAILASSALESIAR